MPRSAGNEPDADDVDNVNAAGASQVHPDAAGDSGGSPAELVRTLVEHWGAMARAWGINTTMGELFALMFITGEDWTAEDLRKALGVSRGNVSMNLRELLTWGVIHKVHRQGERKEFYRAEDNVWNLFHCILTVRKRRELEPTLHLLNEAVRQFALPGGGSPNYRRLREMQEFVALIDRLANRLAQFTPDELRAWSALIAPAREQEQRSGDGESGDGEDGRKDGSVIG